MKIQILALVLIGLSNFSVANTLTLTEERFIAQLKQEHPFFKQQRIRTKIVKNQEALALSGQDWQVEIEANHRHQQTDHLGSANTLYTRNNQTSINSSIARSFYQTGDQLSFGHNALKSSNNSRFYSNTFFVNYSHPLWRNKDGINNQLSVDIAKLEAQKNKIILYDQAQVFLLAKLESLLDLTLLQEQVKIHQKRLVLADQELILTHRKFNASLVEKIDVLSQQDTILQIRQQLLLTKQSLASLRANLAIRLQLPINQIVSQIDLYQSLPIKTIISRQYLARNHYQLKALNIQKQQLQRQLLSNRNEEKPDLSVNLGASTASEDDELAGSLFPQSPEINIGLNLSFALNNAKNKAEKNQILFNLDDLSHQYETMLRNLQAQSNSLSVQLSKIKRILALNLEQVKVAKERSREESRRYKNGLIDANFVISAQNNEQNIALSYAKNATNYQKLYLQYRALLNQIQ